IRSLSGVPLPSVSTRIRRMLWYRGFWNGEAISRKVPSENETRTTCFFREPFDTKVAFNGLTGAGPTGSGAGGGGGTTRGVSVSVGLVWRSTPSTRLGRSFGARSTVAVPRRLPVAAVSMVPVTVRVAVLLWPAPWDSSRTPGGKKGKGLAGPVQTPVFGSYVPR